MIREMGWEYWGLELWGRVVVAVKEALFYGHNHNGVCKGKDSRNWRNVKVLVGTTSSSIVSLPS